MAAAGIGRTIMAPMATARTIIVPTAITAITGRGVGTTAGTADIAGDGREGASAPSFSSAASLANGKLQAALKRQGHACKAVRGIVEEGEIVGVVGAMEFGIVADDDGART